jgi:hypothetical protein
VWPCNGWLYQLHWLLDMLLYLLELLLFVPRLLHGSGLHTGFLASLAVLGGLVHN